MKHLYKIGNYEITIWNRLFINNTKFLKCKPIPGLVSHIQNIYDYKLLIFSMLT